MQWMRAAALLATAAAAPLAAPRALNAQPAQPAPATAVATTAPSTAPTRTIGTTVEDLRAALSDPDTPPPVQQEAARRLVARQTDESRKVIQGIVTAAATARPSARLAVIRALAADPDPQQPLVQALLRFVTSDTDPVLVDAAAQALSAYKSDPRVTAGLGAAATAPRRPLALRIPAVRALGTMVEREAADALVRIVNSPGEPLELVQAADDALVEMTGLDANRRDPAKWLAWQKENAGLAPAEWKAALLDARAAREDRRNRRAEQAADEMQRLVTDTYTRAPGDQKPAWLLRLLNNESPEIRRAGAEIARQVAAQTLGGQITLPIRERLLEMAGDADPGVRADAINATVALNIDPQRVLAVLVPQLAVETDPDVRAAIVRKLGTVHGVGELLALLEHREPEVIREAARALRQRAPNLLAQDPDMARHVWERLSDRMTQLAGQPRYLDARRACADAIAALKDPRSMKFAPPLINAGEPVEIREVAFQILGELGDNAADTIVLKVSQETDPRARAAGVSALGRTGTVAYFDWLVQRMDPRGGEREAETRKAARIAYDTLLRSAKPPKLASEANIRQDRQLRIAVLRELVRQLTLPSATPDDLREAANFRVQLGATYMDEKQFDDAIEPLRAALDYYRKNNAAPAVTDLPLRRLVVAMLGSKRYGDLAAVASDLFADPQHANAYQAIVGVAVRNEADVMRRANQLTDAAALLDAMLGIDWPPVAFYREDLEQLRKQVRAAQQQSPSPSPSPAPAPAPAR